MSYLILPISIVWYELANALMSGLDMCFAGTVFCAITFGLILDIVCFVLQKNKWLVLIFAEALAFFFCIEYFTNTSYFVYLSPMDIVNGAGNLAGEFSSNIIDVIKGGLLEIFIFHIPPIVILVLNICGDRLNIKRSDSKLAVTLLAIIFCQSLSYEAMTKFDNAVYTYSYIYDNAVNSFGVLTAARLDTQYALAGVPDAPIVPVVVAETKESEESSEPEVEEIEYAYHTNDIVYSDLEDLTSSKALKSMLEYVQAQTPSQENEYTGLFEGKNLILIAAESFTKELIREDINPTLYRMATKGIVVEDYYQPAWGGSTSSGESSILLGRIPTNGAHTMLKTIGKDNSYTIASKMQELGYFTLAMHSGTYDYYRRNETHKGLGFSDWIARGTGMEDIPYTWPGDDLATVNFTFDMYADQEPYCVYYMSYSGHGVYNFGGNQMSKNYREIIEEMDLGYSKTVQAYYAANYCFELSLESLLEHLEDAGQLEDTVIVIAADHYPYPLEEGDAWKNDKDYLSELYGYEYDNYAERDHNALIIWSPCLEELDEPIVAKGPSYSVDILPTLLNLFGVEYDSRLYVGRDILSDTEPLAIWVDGSFKTDKGFYSASKKKFIPNEELNCCKDLDDSGDADADSSGSETVSEEYIERMKQIVAGKIDFSRKLDANDFFSFLDSI